MVRGLRRSQSHCLHMKSQNPQNATQDTEIGRTGSLEIGNASEAPILVILLPEFLEPKENLYRCYHVATQKYLRYGFCNAREDFILLIIGGRHLFHYGMLLLGSLAVVQSWEYRIENAILSLFHILGLKSLSCTKHRACCKLLKVDRAIQRTSFECIRNIDWFLHFGLAKKN